MKCQVCGAESGKYPLCRACNKKREAGEVIKCGTCGSWHYKDAPCKTVGSGFLYALRDRLISRNEADYFREISSAVPEGYFVFPQVNLASFIDRTDGVRFRNELFRNVDFLITDGEYAPKIIVEINDRSHLEYDGRERDEKVAKICEEAGIPIIKLWTSYGIRPDYIRKRISEQLAALPVERVHRFEKQVEDSPAETQPESAETPKKKGCYIATAVYGSYDCPEVRVLRRYRDESLSKSPFGRAFIRIYYAISPAAVRIFGRGKLFDRFWKSVLDRLVARLKSEGFDDGEYTDL